MPVNWALGLSQGSPVQSFHDAYDKGVQQRQQEGSRAAMAALVQNPNNPTAFAAFAKADPQAALQFRQQQLQYAKAQLGEHYDNVVKGAQIIRQVNPQNQQGWNQALTLAHQAGIDISQAPQQFDPNYVRGVVSLADAFEPQKEGQMVPFVPGGGVGRINPQTHQPEVLVMPNEGGHPAGSPAGNVPQVHDQASYDAVPPGSQYMGPDGHMRVKQGGQTQPASGGF